MKFSSQLLVAAGCTIACGVNASKIEVCSDSLNDLGIKDIQLPEVVIAGEKVSVQVTSEPNKYIGKGHFRVELYVEGVKVASESHELCSVGHCHLDPHNLVKGAFELGVPAEVPAGFSTTLKVVVNDHNGAQLSCIDMEGVNVNKQEKPASGMLRINSEDLSLSVSELEFLFEKWATEYGMFFEQSEIMDRMKTFADNLEQVALHNKKDSTYSLAINQFAHLNMEEFSKTHFGFNGKANNATVDRSFYEMNVDCMRLGIPDEVDWTTKGAVTDVKNQGSCGSCWAFSTTGALEGAYFLKTGKLVSFSEQELVSCDHVDQGCNGGLMDNADRFIQKAGGLCSEDDYPYVSGRGRHAQCTKCSKVEGSAPKQIVDVAHSESSLEEAVAKAPVSIAIEADQLAFQFYKKGVLTGSCGAALDHGVLAVGYGTLDGTKYWKVKNSWGPAWGMNGYILLQRGKNVRGGECGLLLSASYPVL